MTTNRAFKWSSATGLQSFGVGPGVGGVSEGLGVSEAGQVVGYATGNPSTAFRGGFNDPPATFDQIKNFRATDIEGGAVAGFFNTWEADGTLVPLDAGTNTVAIANAITGDQELAGYVLTAGTPQQAAYWASPVSAPVLIGDLGGSTSTAHGVNGGGVVVGGAETATGQTHAFVWTQAGGIQDLGTLGGTYSEAFDINDSGLIVGTASDASGTTYAVVWDLNGTFDPDLPPVIQFIAPQNASPNETLTITPSISDPEGDAVDGHVVAARARLLRRRPLHPGDRLALQPRGGAGGRRLRLDAG